MKVNILTEKQRCRNECSSTWRHPNAKNNGTMADDGDVRRCEHRRLWEFIGVGISPAGIDMWSPITRWEPIKRRRALKALAETEGTE